MAKITLEARAVIENAEGAMDNQVVSPSMQQPLQIDEDINMQTEQQIPPEAAPEQVQMMDVDQAQTAPIPPPPPEPVLPPEVPAEHIPDTTAETSKEQTVLVENEAEAFALEPLDITGVRDMRIRRKRKLIVDHVIELDGQTMREQLKDFNDIVTTLDMAPPTKRLMQWKEMGGVEKLFTLPAKTTGDELNKLFSINLHTEIPDDLLDITGTQLHEQFGETESSIQIARKADDDTHIHQMKINTSLSTVDQTDSVLLQGKDPSMNELGATTMFQSDDDYEPGSVGPPSVASSIGRHDEPPVIESENPILSGLEPEMGSLVDVALQQSPEDGEAFADDFDDLRWNKRTQHLLHSLHRTFKHEREISFFQMTEGITRKQAVSKFYSLLVLAKQEATLLQQSQVFGDVFIRKGPKFESIMM